MTSPRKLSATLGALALALASCGGSASSLTPSPSTAGATRASAAASTPSPAATPGRTAEIAQIDVDGQTRDFTVVAPPDVATSDPLPLLLVLHGAGQTMREPQLWGYSRFVTDPGAVVVYPQGKKDPLFPDRPGYAWNAGAADTGTDDVAFIAALIGQMEATYPIDPTRVFIAGGSNGGQMAYRAACELADRILGVVVLSGSLLVDCRPVRPLLVIDVHGMSDTIQPPEGGGIGCQPVQCPALAKTMERLRQIDGCSADPDVSEIAPGTTAIDYGSCNDGSALRFIQATGVNHLLEGIQIDFAAVTWQFLMAHHRSTGTG
jgi:polyhydroxybutyrate depolymerase